VPQADKNTAPARSPQPAKVFDLDDVARNRHVRQSSGFDGFDQVANSHPAIGIGMYSAVFRVGYDSVGEVCVGPAFD
jgi:hypothetical protein